MKKFKNYIGLALVILLSHACTNDEMSISPNAIYFEGSTGSNISNVSIDKGGAQIPITIRAAKPIDTKANITIRLDPEALEKYNSENGLNYKILPDGYYTFNSNTFTIEKGKYISNSSTLSVKDISNLPEDDKYAIPITIVQAEGGVSVMNSSKTYYILIDRVLYTSVPEISNSNYINATYKIPYKGLKTWTMEWRVKAKKMGANNQTLLSSYPTEVYTRFGDVVIQTNQLQIKIAGSQFSLQQGFDDNRWYHIAYTYDGRSLICYINGVAVSNNNLTASFDFSNIKFGGGYGTKQVNEIRFWNTVRTASDIRNNMYTIDPNTPGLEGYWKCNEGKGTDIKDYSKNENNMTIVNNNFIWVADVRMPAE
ncbi:BT_3987 domain-containing protein [Elizabethkingia ursingii]|uniref:BT_3987 domain-containing protein n=1 Tax=Elizabethkingia ursingii TaxID=1756150 RepID=UPI0020114BC1|nr:DUF1735 domain-containing protein [Elizabethkingia ursingii]MCL1671533.1 DUF1735 domain-containing protein [Elizabethkingia ursingii]